MTGPQIRSGLAVGVADRLGLGFLERDSFVEPPAEFCLIHCIQGLVGKAVIEKEQMLGRR